MNPTATPFSPMPASIQHGPMHGGSAQCELGAQAAPHHGLAPGKDTKRIFADMAGRLSYREWEDRHKKEGISAPIIQQTYEEYSTGHKERMIGKILQWYPEFTGDKRRANSEYERMREANDLRHLGIFASNHNKKESGTKATRGQTSQLQGLTIGSTTQQPHQTSLPPGLTSGLAMPQSYQMSQPSRLTFERTMQQSYQTSQPQGSALGPTMQHSNWQHPARTTHNFDGEVSTNPSTAVPIHSPSPLNHQRSSLLHRQDPRSIAPRPVSREREESRRGSVIGRGSPIASQHHSESPRRLNTPYNIVGGPIPPAVPKDSPSDRSAEADRRNSLENGCAQSVSPETNASLTNNPDVMGNSLVDNPDGGTDERPTQISKLVTLNAESLEVLNAEVLEEGNEARVGRAWWAKMSMLGAERRLKYEAEQEKRRRATLTEAEFQSLEFGLMMREEQEKRRMRYIRGREERHRQTVEEYLRLRRIFCEPDGLMEEYNRRMQAGRRGALEQERIF